MSEFWLGILGGVFDPLSLLVIVEGVVLGIVVGVLPGLSATLGVALAAPLTFGMDSSQGLLLLLGIYVGAVYGGSISAILLGIPGTPAAVATVLDGQPMSKRGEAGKAIGISTISSFVGGLAGVVMLAVLAKPVGIFGLAFGEREYLALGILALTAVAHLSGASFIKGVFSVAIGLFVATIGIDEIHGIPRFTFENVNMLGGIPYIPVMIGLFAIPETIISTEQLSTVKPRFPPVERVLPSKRMLGGLLKPVGRSSAIGAVVGAVPGTGADIAAIIAYAQGKAMSKHPEKYGTGYPEGIACPESANNAACGGAMVPLLTLGIPGGAVTAIILGAFMVHGLQPGPLLMANNADIVYKLVIGMAVANLVMLLVGLGAARFFGKVSRMPQALLNPIIILLCISGAFSMRNNWFDVYIMGISGIFGYALIKTGIPRPPLVIGMILSGMIESNLARSVMLCAGDVFKFFTPISSGLLVLAVAPFTKPYVQKAWRFLRSQKPAG
ncbi:MAG: tripartite tricarboxylate transporter permease [Desulfarculaceae bacterium]|nr:tripartite tricarboxylate transporter permease [Desulfarculaceae bacterium]MCF8049172.1 tripartite tricarboxylate transporter permease [Desulfarculaceae bacterium]MCF8065421.1 tripartite tricarboxylate transporter permease [Desulfarculaceae bacterium]MCF8096706.1 tripartite tricarboxylate transporter permease [Desulfarculaceae bacterium]